MGGLGAFEMMRTLKVLLCLLLTCLSTEAQKPSESTCGGSAVLAWLSKGQGAALLKSYGYDLQEPWACAKVESAWAPQATILRFRKITVQSDDHTAFSVVKSPLLNYLWVIPTTTGMLDVAHAESDPHNVAAFNALLVVHKGPVDRSGWLEAGRLYMALMGHNAAFPVRNETGVCSGNECSVAFSDRPVVSGEAYNKWTLTFTRPTNGQTGRLTDVSRETIEP